MAPTLDWKLLERRVRGRPRSRWNDELKEEVGGGDWKDKSSTKYKCLDQ